MQHKAKLMAIRAAATTIQIAPNIAIIINQIITSIINKINPTNNHNGGKHPSILRELYVDFGPIEQVQKIYAKEAPQHISLIKLAIGMHDRANETDSGSFAKQQHPYSSFT